MDFMLLTPFGAFLRSSSLDELPELLNVLKGEMSLVGPKAFINGISSFIQQPPKKAPLCSTGDNRLGSSQWSKCYFVGRKVQFRRLVC